MLFHWDPPGRQVRIEGRVQPLDPSENGELIRAREPRSRIISMASLQSRPLSSRDELARRVETLEQEYPAASCRSLTTGAGTASCRQSFEFWQQGRNRFHDRFRYELAGGEWTIQRLFPIARARPARPRARKLQDPPVPGRNALPVASNISVTRGRGRRGRRRCAKCATHCRTYERS